MEDWTACNDAVRLKGVGVCAFMYECLSLCVFLHVAVLFNWEGGEV